MKAAKTVNVALAAQKQAALNNYVKNGVSFASAFAPPSKAVASPPIPEATFTSPPPKPAPTPASRSSRPSGPSVSVGALPDYKKFLDIYNVILKIKPTYDKLVDPGEKEALLYTTFASHLLNG